jgi:hypothetical protein
MDPGGRVKRRCRGALVVAGLALTACGRPGERAVDDLTLSGVRPTLEYGPALVSLKGTVDTIFQYGPPGFGENPAVDQHVVLSVLRLNAPIDVEGDSTSAFNRDDAVNIRMLQLAAATDRAWAGLTGKEVVAHGTLFHAQAAEHYTEVLLQVDSIVPEPAR